MDVNEKLDLILTKLEALEERTEGISEAQDELKESVANLSLPGSGYSVFTPDE